jgi:hypothetical protein
MALVFFKGVKIGLNGFSSLQKNHAYRIARNTADKAPGVFNHAADTPVKAGHVNGLFRRQYAKFLRREPAVPGNVGEHFFRRLAGKAAYGGANRSPEGKDGFMDGPKVNNVARFAPVGGGRCLVCCEVHGMQDVTKNLILLRGKKAKRAVVNPFKAHPVAKPFNLCVALAGDDLFS